MSLAVSLDGYIEGPNGEYDWCFTDQDYGLSDFFKRIDTVFIGRKTYEMTLNTNGGANFPKIKEYIFSTTLSKVKKDATLINNNVEMQVRKIKQEKGKDIWLFGGAGLTASLINLKLVDELSLAVHPLLLGKGTPLFSTVQNRVNLSLIETKSYNTGLVVLAYKII
jgi:dihydrofolate reductase